MLSEFRKAALALLIVAAVAVEMVPARSGSIAVSVVDGRGRPVEGCVVERRPLGMAASVLEYAAVTDGAGTATLHSLKSGWWLISCDCEDAAGPPHMVYVTEADATLTLQVNGSSPR